ncbi:hypothetical protein ACMWQC_06990 [Helicobacter pylori]|uniref:hypothetical protein n=1 Tax=Helicobacter pylori TaxID=210 RepID=UPI0039E00847
MLQLNKNDNFREFGMQGFMQGLWIYPEDTEVLGVALHKPTNDNPGNGLVDLSQSDSKVKVLLIPTDEELEIALQAKEIVEKLK